MNKRTEVARVIDYFDNDFANDLNLLWCGCSGGRAQLVRFENENVVVIIHVLEQAAEREPLIMQKKLAIKRIENGLDPVTGAEMVVIQDERQGE